MAPTPDPDVLDVQAAARAATLRSTSAVSPPGGDPTRPPFAGFLFRSIGENNGGNGNGNGSTNGSNSGSNGARSGSFSSRSDSAVAAALTPDGNPGRTRAAPPPVAPYKPATMEVFTCVIWVRQRAFLS
jgi:hypothetical protein